jgi:hypothetical protein
MSEGKGSDDLEIVVSIVHTTISAAKIACSACKCFHHDNCGLQDLGSYDEQGGQV